MRRVRLIPVLLLDNGRLVKSTRFRKYNYVGDPINAVKILNEKEVDELMILDITATKEGRKPDMKLLAKICGEAFMPLAYGGAVTNPDYAKELFYTGFEKVVINYGAFNSPGLVSQLAGVAGSQSIIASIDVRKTLFQGYKCFYLNGTRNSGRSPVEFAKEMENAGAGEILVNSIDKDGTFDGLDTRLVSDISRGVSIPVIACGGLNSLQNIREAINSGASAVAAGSFFVYKRPHNAVLISYPSQTDLRREVYAQI